MFGNTLVPLDGSTLADRILPYVAVIAQGGTTSVTLVRVLETDDVAETPADLFAWHFAKAGDAVAAAKRSVPHAMRGIQLVYRKPLYH